MKKIFSFLRENILFVETLILLAFIPLYPKLPLISVRNTWVYVRAEDFLILLVLFSWVFLLFKKKVSLRTPLTIPILIFWLVGAISTINGVLLIFPTLANVFPNVAFLSLIRHFEYLSLFFVAFHGMKDRSFLKAVIGVSIATLLGIIFYGFGQRYLGFPAFLTGNEEFAKGIPIQLSQLSRVPSTFAGHYDLAAYLVLMIPIVVSLIFGVKNLFVKAFLSVVTVLSFLLLFMTVSRVSFFVVFVSILIVFFFQKRKIVFLLIPVIVLAALMFISLKPALLDRFKSTVKDVDVLVDAKTGNSIGHVEFVDRDFFKDKIVLQRRILNQQDLVSALAGDQGNNTASTSSILPFNLIPKKQSPLVRAVNISNGEVLPQGTGYVNLELSPVIKKSGIFFYEFPPNVKSSPSADFIVLKGSFIVKRAAAYDLSFTTRFQGEWPRAVEAFTRNVPLGSGYGSVSLAVDNNFLRMLGEVGLLGFSAFMVIFISFGIYLKKSWGSIQSNLDRSFLIGFLAGVIGLFLNATLIDVFEASKVAYPLWALMGVSMGLIMLNRKTELNLLEELKRAATSTYAMAIYILAFIVVMYSSTISNFFVGDDFTWLRWAAQAPSNLLTYFTNSDGFFYRPGTKIYFYLMYHFFWLNPIVYHLVSVVLHFLVSFLAFILFKKITKNTLISAASVFLFLLASGYSEVVFWVAATGHLFNAVLTLLGIILFINWEERKKLYFYVLSFLSFSAALFFHELGVIFPLFILAYKLKDGLSPAIKTLRRKDFLLLFLPIIFYLSLRLLSNSHWFNGDYSYDILKLPFNIVGNALGYFGLSTLGTFSLNFYESLRSIARENIIISLAIMPILFLAGFYIYKRFKAYFDKEEKSIIIFGLAFFIVSLLPFLGLGNITSRYSYMATLGLMPILVIFFKKIYNYLLVSGRGIAVLLAAILILTYSLFQIISVQKTASDWNGASFKTNNFFISFDSLYSDYWSQIPIQFHFVNVPIKSGEAWVFPVGLKDAVWFAVKNDQANIHLDNDVDYALQQVGASRLNKIFVFQDDGSLSEVTKRLTK